MRKMFFCTIANVHSSRIAADYADDDDIKIVCPGEVNGDVTCTIMMKRSSLKRSGPLNNFFESKDYRFGCGMTLYFTEVPGRCFGLVKDYLDDGPDRFKLENMMHQVSRYYIDGGKRMEIYTRLHKCARQLELQGLKNMAFIAISLEEGALTPDHCMTLASFIFAENGGFGQVLKNWLMGHIKKNFEALNANPIVRVNPEVHWSSMVNTLSPTFKKNWKIIVNGHARVQAHATQLSPVDEEDDEQEQQYLQTLQNHNDADLARAEDESRNFNEDKEDQQEVLGTAVNPHTKKLVQIKADKEESEGWEDANHVEHICPDPALHLAANSPEPRTATHNFEVPDDVTPRHRSFDLETAKARRVLGINSPSHGTIAGRRKEPTLTRAAKSLNNLMRSASTPRLSDFRRH